MKKFLATAAIVLPLVGAILTGVAIANTDYAQQVVDARAQTLFQNFGSLENRAPTLFTMSQVVAARTHHAQIGVEPVSLARLDR